MAVDREGTHQANLAIQVVDHEGRAVDAEVSIHRTTPGWGGSTRELATTRTDTEGKALFKGITSAHRLSMFVDPPDHLRPVYRAVQAVTNATSDLGVVRLKRNYVVTGVLWKQGEGRTRERVNDGRVTLIARSDDTELASSRIDDGRFRLENFDVVPMDIGFNEFSFWAGAYDYRGPFTFGSDTQPMRIDLLIEPRPDGGTALRAEKRDPPPEQAERVEPSYRIEGRLVGPDRKPLSGLEVSIRRGLSTVTDTDGRFILEDRSPPTGLNAWLPSGRLHLVDEADDDEWLGDDTQRVVVGDFTEPFEVEAPFARRLKVSAVGANPEDLSYGWLVGDRWQALGRAVLEVVIGRRLPALIRAEKPGHLPRLAAFPPPDEDLSFDFTVDEPHGLLVVGPSGPVAGATVDVVEAATAYREHVAINDRRSTVRLESVSTDARGRVERLGNPQALYIAYIYAVGFEPVRVRLHADAETRVEVEPRSTRVEFTGLRTGELLRVKAAGRDSLVALHRVVDESGVTVSLAPGTYDASVENADFAIARGLAFDVAGEPLRVDLAVDRRPELVLRLPELPFVSERYLSEEEKTAVEPPRGRWSVWASRRTTYGRPIGALAVSSRGSVSARERPVEVDVLEDGFGETVRLLRFAGSGRWLVYVAAERRSIDHLFFVEVDLEAGERSELELPPLDAALEGSMGYEGDLDFNHHGVAGPRMMLIAADGSDAGWNIVNFLPERLAREGPDRARFVLDGLPAGDYHLVHHLGERPAWAGVPVSLRGGRAAVVAELGSEEGGEWTVEVVDREGRPVVDRILRIRDRMHEAWAAYTEIPTTGVYAADPIPIPPAARLRGEPISFESIRSGWVELVLDDPAGPARHYLRKAEPGTKLTLVVDD